jgi:fructose-bisphosphate aldolase class 1
VAGDKGLLAMDESTPTCNRRFAALGIPQTDEARRAYRELIVTTPNLGECISGAILFDQTIHQETRAGIPFVKVLIDAGIIPGIKVDAGAKDLAGHPGEKVTEGLDGLRERLAQYAQMGARFAKWRAVIVPGDGIPSRGCIEANAQRWLDMPPLCQEAGLVPIVEPEVLMDGDHTLARCAAITEEVLRAVFEQLYLQRVTLEGMILKPNMVVPGLACPTQATVDEVADATVKVPPSGGSRCRSGDRLPLGRATQRAGLGPPECHERPLQGARALGIGVLVRSRHSATGDGDLARRGVQCARGPAGSVPSSRLQPGCAPRRIQRRDGEGVSMTVKPRDPTQVLLYPLRFEPIYQYRLWGGRRLADLLTAPLPGDGPIGEAWVLSDRDDHASRVADGPLKGRTIGQLMEQFPEQMLGKAGRALQPLPAAAQVPRRARDALAPGASRG